MYRSNIYPKVILCLSFMLLGFSSVFAQFELKLQLMNDTTWGVYARTDGSISPTANTTTGSGQVTLVAPTGFTYSDLTSVSGLWTENARVNAPSENSARDYISFGFSTDTPHILYTDSTETLLFTIKKVDPCPDTLYLIENGVDPFDQLPNSAGTNPGNDLSVVDYGYAPLRFYYYSDNYAFSAWSCHDCDGDGILNALEDTNGNGVFDPGIDVSDICDPCDPIHVESAYLDFVGGADSICFGDATDTAYLVATIIGGWIPYTVVYSDGTVPYDTVFNYHSGDSIPVVPIASSVYQLINVIDSFGCEIDPDSLNGLITIEVEGPLSITDQPDAVVECSGNSTSFSIVAANGGVGVIHYNWQVSTNNGVTWTDIVNGTPYSTATTTTLNISNVAGLHNRQYRMRYWTNHCDPVFSNAALLQVEGPITVSAHPANTSNCETEAVSFTAATVNSGAVGTMSYQWQYSPDCVTFYDIPNGAGGPGGGTYANATTTTINLTNLDVAMDGWCYRMKVSTGQCDTVFTNAAILDVEGAIAITNDPDDFTNCAGNEVIFVAEYSNPGAGYGTQNINYIWQVSTNNGATWANISNSNPAYQNITGVSVDTIGSDTLVITNVVGLNGNQYRICYTSATCSVPTYSAGALLNVNGNVAFSNHPDDITVCSGNDTIFVACASIPQGSFYYFWEFSSDNGATWDSLEMTGVFSHSNAGALIAGGCDTLFISDVAGLYNWRFRAVAASSTCDGVTSLEARLAVEGPLTVSDHPDPVTECSGNAAQFSAIIDNPGVAGSTIYRWQTSVDGGVTWINLTNNAVYGGTSTPTLLIANVAGLHGRCYRLSARTGTCTIIYTNFACLTVEGPITVTDQPDNVTLCSGQATSFTSTADVGTAGTLSQIWQVSSDNGLNWTSINAGTDGGVYTNFTTTTLNVSDVTGLYSRCYRLQFSTTECNPVNSQKACLTVEGPIAFTNQPDDVTECSGDPVQFIVATSNTSPDVPNGVLYQWQESVNGGTTWSDLTDDLVYGGVNTDTILISNIIGKDNYEYRCIIWTDHCARDTSDAATLFVEGPISVIDEPDNITECSGSGVTFQATLTNGGLGTILYQWERSCDLGLNWTDVANGGPEGYSGSTTTTLVITDVAGLDSCRFRLRYWTATCSDAWSNYAVVTVEGPIDFALGSGPFPDTVCSGSPAQFEVTTVNPGSGGITYQWQVSLDGCVTWNNLNNNSIYNGTKSSNLSISNSAGLNGRCYRVLIQTSTCAAIASSSATLSVEGPVAFTDHPDDITQCSSEGVFFKGSAGIAVGNDGTIEYQWQASSDCINFVDIADGGPSGYTGTNTDSLYITNVAGLSGWCFRLTARTGVCNRVNSFSAKLFVEGPLSIVLNPIDVTNCSDEEAFFYSDILNPGVGGDQTISYQWQVSNDNSTWSNVLDGTFGPNNYGGATEDTLLIAPLTGLDSTFYRLMAWSGTCDTLYTTTALLRVQGPVTFTDQPDDVTLCSNEATSFTVAVDNFTGVGTVQYQWEVSTNGGSVWADLNNTGVYTGSTTNTLNISNVATLYNYKYRCRVRIGDCDWQFSQLANLFVEGPITINLQPVDASVCSNIGHIFTSDVTNPGSGALQFQWQVSINSGVSWANITNASNTGYNTGNYQGAKTEELNITLVEGMDGLMYRMLIRTGTCYDTTNEVVLSVLDACLTGICDLDLDGEDNDTDLDDDNDQLLDYWEDWMNVQNVVDGWNWVDDGPLNVGGLIFYNRCLVDTDGDGILDNQEDPDGDNLNNGEETDNDGVFDGNPLDPCDPILGPTCIGINLAIKAQLQGALIGVTSGGQMRDQLRTKGLIPLQEPYEDMTAFSHTQYGGLGGTEVIADSLAILGVSGDKAIVDWVFVELRSANNLDSIYATRSALLTRDGHVVDMDGDTILHYPTANAGSFYVALRHRNHLGVMTGEALDLSPIVQEVDFTDPSYLTNGTNAQVNLNGKMALWGGDLNSNRRTIYQGPNSDVFALFSQVIADPGNFPNPQANWISQGYLTTDINLDGRSIYQGPLNDRAMVLFNVILSHPENTNNLANFVIFEQLP